MHAALCLQLFPIHHHSFRKKFEKTVFNTKTEVENRIHGNSASGILVLVLVPVNNDDVGLAV